ncbi:MAG TPA: oligosaccharide flippase family protein, partial [Azospira sp.]|nr:oligosaccharide flippase family protein [Azospira sp.]
AAGSGAGDAGNAPAPAAVPASPPYAALRRRAFSLGAANAFDYGMQFLLPMVLVRFMAPEAFGEYRLLWLAIMTVMVLVPLNMPHTLYYFLPRADRPARRLHVHMTLLYLVAAGVLGGLAVSPWNPLLPASMRSLAEYGLLVPALVVLCAATFLLDMLPTAEERVRWQVGVIATMSLLRTLTLGWAAWQIGEVRVLIWLLLGLTLFKLLLLLAYIARFHGLGGPWFEPRRFAEQFRHASPLGLSSALYGVRGQADQWVVASLFPLANFAVFSVATVLGPMVNLFRQSINNVFLPSMSRLQSSGDLAGMVELNNRANVMVATLVYPLLAFAFVFAEEIVTLIYTECYAAAAPVMRVYIAGLLIFVVELSSIMLLMRQGAFALRLNLAVLAASVLLSWLGAQQFGLAGAAAGSTLAMYADRYATLYRIAATTGVPLRALQDWGALARLLAIAVLAGAAAAAVVGHYLADAALPLRLLLGASVLYSLYGLLWAALGRRRGPSSPALPVAPVPPLVPPPPTQP